MIKNSLFIGILVLCSWASASFGQISPPYYNYFDQPNDTLGWSHYALSGTDDWVVGSPLADNLFFTYSSPNAWLTSLDGNYATNSDRILETPAFNLSNSDTTYVLSFYQMRESSATVSFKLEYSIDNGNTWPLLVYPNMRTTNWQSNTGFTANTFSMQMSAIDLRFLQGESNVRFRFHFVSGTLSREGWLIDNFKIDQENFNLSAQPGDSMFVSQNCAANTVQTSILYDRPFSSPFLNVTDYYLSTDDILDEEDSLIFTKSQQINGLTNTWDQYMTFPDNLNPGDYFIIYRHDALNNLEESDENDNIGYAVLHVDSVYQLPVIDDFETEGSLWYHELAANTDSSIWELGLGYRHHIEGAHSGKKAWHTSRSINLTSLSNCMSGCNPQYLESEYMDLTSVPSPIVFNLWYKSDLWSPGIISYTTNCGYSSNTLYTFTRCRQDEWDFANIPLNLISSSDNIQFKIMTTISTQTEGLVVDDIYIGPIKPDLSIERDKRNRFTPSTAITDSLKYYLYNCGRAASQQTTTTFYWSTDSIFDASDILLGSKLEQSFQDTARVWTSFSYNKPNTFIDTYFIFYVLDTYDEVGEMREYNNIGYFTIFQNPPVTLPYYNDFETQVDGWRHNASLGKDDWEWTTPNGTILDTAFSGSLTWITNDTGLVSSMSRMHLYSPIFDFSAAFNPVLEFDMKLHNPVYEGQTNMSYSIDGGATWIVLDNTTNSFNRWYYNVEYGGGIDYLSTSPNYRYLLFDRQEETFMPYNAYNGRNTYRNTHYNLDIGFLAGYPKVQFRYNLATQKNKQGPVSFPSEGALIDNFSISEAFIDINIDYRKALMISSNVNQLKFYMNIKNQGNYITNPSNCKFYVSADSLLDTTDYYLGEISIPQIVPDKWFYTNQAFPSPPNLSTYSYLLYALDEMNTNEELDEINNLGYWPLALDSIHAYPYVNDFNDTIVDGWHQFTVNHITQQIDPNYRFRTIVAPAEVNGSRALQSGQWFTEPYSYYDNVELSPMYYLESPVFDFTDIDSIFLSFDLLSVGSGSNTETYGSNLEYSKNGGNLWSLLVEPLGEGYNWYNVSSLTGMNNQQGWALQPTLSNNTYLDSTSFDASFLKGESRVVFRFKHRGAWSISHTYPFGMRVDNFMVEGFKVDYQLQDSLQCTNINLDDHSLTIDYSITNSGQFAGRITNTHFYWSLDSIFDVTDQLIHTVEEARIPSGETLNYSAIIPYPTPINQIDYYVFCKTDGDDNLNETNEFNNVQFCKVTFPLYANYYVISEMDTIEIESLDEPFNLQFKLINNGFVDGSNSATQFILSTDNSIDITDLYLQSINQAPLLIGDSLLSSVNLNCPATIEQAYYYLFIQSDSNGEILELDEADNIEALTVHFLNWTTIGATAQAGALSAFVFDDLLFVNAPNLSEPKNFKLKMTNSIGQSVFEKDVSLTTGANKFPLPGQLSNGVYTISLFNQQTALSSRIIIQK